MAEPLATRPWKVVPAAPAVVSATSDVPPVVPSVRHSSKPATPSSARKYQKPPIRSNPGEKPLSTKWSRNSTVPAAVPSVFQSCIEVAVATWKTVMEPARSDTLIAVPVASICAVPELFELSIARMRLPPLNTIDEVVAAIAIPDDAGNVPSFTFPDEVPSLRHTSVDPEDGLNKKEALKSAATAARWRPEPMDVNMVVPAAVPSVFQSCRLKPASSATARKELPNGAPSPMKNPSVGTCTVPASVPSVFQSR